MADIDLKTETPDTSLPTTGFLFGADSQAAASPSVYSTQAVATTLLGSTTLTGATVTTSSPVIDATQTWDDGGANVTFTGLKFNATDTASASGSLLMDLQVGGVSQAAVSKAGIVRAAGIAPITGTTMTIAANTAFVGASQIFFDFNVLGGATTAAASRSLMGNGFSVGSAFGYGFSSTTAANGVADLFLTRRAAANLRIGNTDAANDPVTPAVAQTLSVQSVATNANNTNRPGKDFTITGSQGTGTGAGGSIIFQVAPAGSSGTAQNALATALTINSTQNTTFSGDIYLSSFGSIRASGSYSGTVFLYGGSSIKAYAANNLDTFGVINGINFQSGGLGTEDLFLRRDAANTLALRNGANAQEQRVYGSFTATDNFQRMSIKTLRESSGALSGATYVTTIAIPAYANLIGVTTRVTTAVTGATTYDVGDGSDVDLWGAAIGIALGSQSRTADFTAVGAVGAAATSRTVTLTANGSNFTGGVVEICLHYLTTEAD